MKRIKAVVIVGPTASGKSALAMELAERFNGEIVSADSMQVFRYMDIGTAKPTVIDRKRVPHHLIDVVDPDEEFTAARYRDEASRAVDDINKRGRNVFIVGGTGLYIKALTKGLFKGPCADMRLRDELAVLAHLNVESEGDRYLYERLKEVDPETASKIHPNNTVRIIRALEVYYLTDKPMSVFQREHNFSEYPYDILKIGLKIERDLLRKRINDRMDNMVNAGIAEEVKRLLDANYSPLLKSMQGLGYKEFVKYLKSEYTLEEAREEMKKNTQRYAKRQMTWFRRETDITWLSSEGMDAINSLVEKFLK